mmetsp:Transcript_45168/g.107477  ORF Transcript_45168/g.107477 Transcript_45168/m.107477 type:complete len:222 (+) Transcript_45168:1077-1742(+)
MALPFSSKELLVSTSDPSVSSKSMPTPRLWDMVESSTARLPWLLWKMIALPEVSRIVTPTAVAETRSESTTRSAATKFPTKWLCASERVVSPVAAHIVNPLSSLSAQRDDVIETVVESVVQNATPCSAFPTKLLPSSDTTTLRESSTIKPCLPLDEIWHCDKATLAFWTATTIKPVPLLACTLLPDMPSLLCEAARRTMPVPEFASTFDSCRSTSTLAAMM